MLKFRFLCSCFQILFIRIFNLKKKEKSRSPHSTEAAVESETVRGSQQHHCIYPSPGISPAPVSAKSAPNTKLCSLFSPSASLPSGSMSSPGSVPTTVAVHMPKPSRVQQALAGRHAAPGLGVRQDLGVWEVVGWGVTLCVLMETQRGSASCTSGD